VFGGPRDGIDFDRLRAELAPTVITDAAMLLWQLRMTKEAWELDAMRASLRDHRPGILLDLHQDSWWRAGA